MRLKTMSLQARKELIKSVRSRYKTANHNDKQNILCEIVENTFLSHKICNFTS